MSQHVVVRATWHQGSHAWRCGVHALRRYTSVMSTADLRPDRPELASDTRRMSEAERLDDPTQVSGRMFWIALVLIVAVIAVFFVVR